jgi:hypothetical protein
MEGSHTLLNITEYMLLEIFQYLNKGEIFILYETCTSFYNFIRLMRLEKRVPHNFYIIKTMNMLTWAESHLNFNYSEELSRFAVRNNNMLILNYMYDKGYPLHHLCYHEAISQNNFKIIKWLKNRNVRLISSVFTSAAYHGNFKIIKWLKNIDCPRYDFDVINNTALSGNVRILRYLIKHDFYWDSIAFNYACMSGNIDIIKVLYESSFNDLSKPWWNASVCATAAKYNHLHILKYLRKYQCPWNIETAYNVLANAMNTQNNETLKWIIENGCAIDEEIYQLLPRFGLNYERNQVRILQ